MKRGSDPAKIRLWNERLARFENSGLKVAEFCQQEGISQPSFYQWKRKLGDSGAARPASSTQNRKDDGQKSGPFRALEVSTGSTTGVTIRMPGGIEIDLGHDWPTIEKVIGQLLDQPLAKNGDSTTC